jgi:cytidylate kinase
MSWLSNMTRAQKEQYVIELFKQGKTTREIAQRTHMSFRDIGVITNKVKAEVERESRQTKEEIDNIGSKSKESRAFKLFSEGKTPIEVVIALDLPADEVRAIYREFWELKRMYKLVQIYEETKYDLHTYLRLHKIVKDLGMGEQEIINVLELANHNQLQYLQWKVEYLRNDIDMLEIQKTKSTNHILILNRRIDEYRETLGMYGSSLAQKREEMAYMNQDMNQESRMLQRSVNNNTDNSYPVKYSEPDTSSYSIRLSYTHE